MTRSAEQAIDEAQAKLGERCERLLASSAWNNAHTTTHKGLLKRLQMIPDAGLNPMRVVAHSKLKELGRIPRSHEGHQEDAIAAVRRCGADSNNYPKAVLLFYSHRWKRPNWSEDLGKDLPWESAERQQAMRTRLGGGGGGGGSSSIDQPQSPNSSYHSSTLMSAPRDLPLDSLPQHLKLRGGYSIELVADLGWDNFRRSSGALLKQLQSAEHPFSEDLDEGLSIFADAVKTVADRHGVSGEPKPHTTGRPAVLRGLTGGSSFDGA